MPSKQILVVEDDTAIKDMIVFNLNQAGFENVAVANSGAANLQINNQFPDLIILDWMLPGMSGVDFLKQLKKDAATKHIPVIMLTARTDEQDKVQGLNSGADDYVGKPFSPKELIARINAIFRRVAAFDESDILKIDGLMLDIASRQVEIDGSTVLLGPTEFKLLAFFMSNPNRVYSREQLLDRVWGRNAFIEERTIDVHIRRLRKALDTNGYAGYIKTVRGAGYRFSS